MKNYFSNLSKIRKHKSLHKDSLNLFDINSNDVTLNGLIPSDELWNKELPNEVILIFHLIFYREIRKLRQISLVHY